MIGKFAVIVFKIVILNDFDLLSELFEYIEGCINILNEWKKLGFVEKLINGIREICEVKFNFLILVIVCL